MSTQQVNLYQETFHTQPQPLSTQRMWLIILLALSVTLLLSGYNAWQIYTQKNYLADLKHTVAVVSTQQRDISNRMINYAPDSNLQQKIKELEQVLVNQRKIEDLIKQHVTDDSAGYSGYFFAFARHHIDDLWLTGISIGQNQTLSLRGQTNQPETVPRYLRQLSSEEILSGTEFQVFQLERPLDEEKALSAETVNFLVSTDLQAKDLQEKLTQ